MRFASALLFLVLCAPAEAHDFAQPAGAGSAWTYDRWTFDPWVLSLLLFGAGLYVTGTLRVWAHAGIDRGMRIRQAAFFGSGVLAFALALTSPLHWLGERLF